MKTAVFLALNVSSILLVACGAAASTPIALTVPASVTATTLPPPTIPSWFATLEARWTTAPTEAPKTPTSTPLPTPTLSRQDQDRYALQLVATNGGCELPCLFGVVPGQTTRAQLERIIQPLSEYQLGPLNLNYLFEGRRAFLTIDAKILRPSDPRTGEPVVSAMVVGLDTKAVSPSGTGMLPEADLAHAAASFYLANILSRFGPPSRIFLRASPPDQILGWPPYFGLILFYDELGFSVAYRLPPTPKTTSGTIRHCFWPEDIEAIEIAVLSSEDEQSLEQSIDNLRGRQRAFAQLVQDKVFIAMEEATGHNIVEFSEMYRVPQPTCLYSPAEIWSLPALP